MKVLVNLFLFSAIIGCSDFDNNEIKNHETGTSVFSASGVQLLIGPDISSKTEYLYDHIMEVKNIVFSLTGPCDDALGDTLYERHVPYIENEYISDSTIEVFFKFKATCCRSYGGDYAISKDTLTFQYGISNNEECPCTCWYRYKLSIGGLTKKIGTVIIKAK